MVETTTVAKPHATAVAATSVVTRCRFPSRKDGVAGRVAAVEYDPNRTCRIALIHYTDGEKAYISAPKVSLSATP